MSDVTRDDHGFHDSDSGRAFGLASGQPRGASGANVRSGEICRMDRGLSGRGDRDRVAELTAATDRSLGRVPVFPWIGTRSQLISEAIEDRRVVVTHLRAACRAERQRGINRHWTYSKPRHDALARLLEREESELHAMMEAV